jgi:hypothetical protein
VGRPAPQTSVAAHQAPCNDGQGGAHGDGRGQQDADREGDPEGYQPRLGFGRTQPCEGLIEVPQHRKRQQGVEADARFEPRIDAQRPFHPVEPTGGREVPQCKASEEDRKHDGDGLGARPQGEAQEAGPDQLIDQRGEPGEDQACDDDALAMHAVSTQSAR